MVFVLNLTIPVVDYGKEDHNWNKWLNVLHCITMPVFGVLATKGLLNERCFVEVTKFSHVQYREKITAKGPRVFTFYLKSTNLIIRAVLSFLPAVVPLNLFRVI